MDSDVIYQQTASVLPICLSGYLRITILYSALWCHQTGKGKSSIDSTIDAGLNRKIINGPCSIAMFDYRRVIQTATLIWNRNE